MLTKEEEMEARRRFQNMRLIDNDLMNIAFSENNEAVEYVIQTILGRKDLKVESSTLQDYQALPGNQKSVILDILAVDDKGNYYNVEMQTTPHLASAKRARYHCSIIDNYMLGKGQDYSEVTEVYVIFITEGSFLGLKDVPIEFFERVGKYTKSTLEDKQTIVYVNARCQEGNTELAKLMRDLTARRAEEINSQVLKDAVNYAKGDKQEMYIEGLNKNQDEIWAKATQATMISNIRSCFNNGVSVDLLSKSFSMKVDEIEAILGKATESH